MAVNKVVFGGETIINLTNDTVTPDTLAEGVTAHDASGNAITGRMAQNTVPEYTAVVNGETKLPEAGSYVVKGAYKEDAFGGNKIRIIGKEEDIRSPFKLSDSLNPFFSFALKRNSSSPRPDATNYSTKIGSNGEISIIPGTANSYVDGKPTPFTWYDSAWLWYNQKLCIPNLKFSLELPSHSCDSAFNNGIGFFFCARLSGLGAGCYELASVQGFDASQSEMPNKIVNKNQNLILFNFTPTKENNAYCYRLAVGSVYNGANGYGTQYSYQTFSAGKHTISFDGDSRIYVDGERVLWGDNGLEWRYIAGNGSCDYGTRAYLGFVVTNYGDTHFSATIHEITNNPNNEIGNLKHPANCFSGGWQVTGTYTYNGIECGWLPSNGSATLNIKYQDTKGTIRSIALIASADMKTFAGDTLCFGKNACIIKHSDGNWYLHTRKLDGTPIEFALTESANETLNNYPPAIVWDKSIADGNKINAEVEYYSEISASKPVLWDGTASDHHLCDFKTFDNENHKAKVKIAADGVITWKNSFENGTDGVQALAFYKL